jgi:hypothetical protein
MGLLLRYSAVIPKQMQLFAKSKKLGYKGYMHVHEIHMTFFIPMDSFLCFVTRTYYYIIHFLIKLHAKERLQKYGPNEITEEMVNPILKSGREG